MKKLLILLFVLWATVANAGIATVQQTDFGNYQVTMDSGNILSVPNAPGNRHYSMIQEWVGEGNTITPPPAWAPDVVKARKKRIKEIKRSVRGKFREFDEAGPPRS